MSLTTFFNEHPLFYYEELLAYLKSLGHFNKNTINAGLQYHLSKKHLVRIRRGYYLVTNNYMPGIHVESDYLLIAGRISIQTKMLVICSVIMVSTSK